MPSWLVYVGLRRCLKNGRIYLRTPRRKLACVESTVKTKILPLALDILPPLFVFRFLNIFSIPSSTCTEIAVLQLVWYVISSCASQKESIYIFVHNILNSWMSQNNVVLYFLVHPSLRNEGFFGSKSKPRHFHLTKTFSFREHLLLVVLDMAAEHIVKVLAWRNQKMLESYNNINPTLHL
jgi:hypothetical protein